MAEKTGSGRPHIKLTAYWGNGDAESTIKVSRRRWRAIQKGAAYETNGWSWYEGDRFSVTWRFGEGLVSIDGEDARQCIVDSPVSELFAQASDPDA